MANIQPDRLRDLFVEGVAALLDHEDLVRRVDFHRGEAQTDPLTGLPNRRYLEEHVTKLFTAGGHAALGVCDLDGFKQVNTRHGHLSGDLVLQRVAGVLNRVMRKGTSSRATAATSSSSSCPPRRSPRPARSSAASRPRSPPRTGRPWSPARRWG
ncbi:hypothetical protein GCM10027610_134420 [Dactylosporangium cerinum]